MLRRLLFVAICLFAYDYPGIQIILVNLLNLFFGIYYGYFKPFEERLKSYLDAFNELTIAIVTYHMMMFTDFTSDLTL